MKNIIFLFCIASVCYSQKYDSLLNSLGSSIKSIVIQQNKLLKFNDLTIQIKSDTTLSICNKILINNKVLEDKLIKNGNTDLLDINDFEFHKTFYFFLNEKNYLYIPLYIKNCHGRSCRYYSCLLIQIDNLKKVTTFFFGNDECEDYFYFKLIDKHLAFLNLNVKTDFSKKTDEEVYEYSLSLLLFNDKLNTWEKALDTNKKEIFINFSAKNHFVKDEIKIINENWSKKFKK